MLTPKGLRPPDPPAWFQQLLRFTPRSAVGGIPDARPMRRLVAHDPPLPAVFRAAQPHPLFLELLFFSAATSVLPLATAQ